MSIAGEVARGVLISVLVSIISFILIIGLIYLILKFGLIPYIKEHFSLAQIIKDTFGGK